MFFSFSEIIMSANVDHFRLNQTLRAPSASRTPSNIWPVGEPSNRHEPAAALTKRTPPARHFCSLCCQHPGEGAGHSCVTGPALSSLHLCALLCTPRHPCGEHSSEMHAVTQTCSVCSQTNPLRRMETIICRN